MVDFYHLLKEEKGMDFALDRLNDGAGYYLTAKVWVPFTEPEKAFILYTCFDIWGNEVSLQKLDDHECRFCFSRDKVTLPNDMRMDCQVSGISLIS